MHHTEYTMYFLVSDTKFRSIPGRPDPPQAGEEDFFHPADTARYADMDARKQATQRAGGGAIFGFVVLWHRLVYLRRGSLYKLERAA